jgi:hypothetical protein
MASTVIYVRLDPQFARLLDFVGEVATYAEEHDNTDLAESCMRLRDDIEWIALTKAAEESP